MHFYVAGFSAGTAVEILINMVAAIALYMKVCNFAHFDMGSIGDRYSLISQQLQFCKRFD